MGDSIATAFLFKRATQIGSVLLDCSLQETHTAENDVTDHPVEEGFNVTDNVRPKPDMLSIEGLVSNTPFSRTGRRRIVEALGITFASATDEDQPANTPGYAEQAYLDLRSIRDTGQLITVVTGLRTYENMAMVSLVVPRNRTIGDALSFTCSLKRVRVVRNKLAAAKVSSSPNKKVSTGKQAPKKATADEQKKSWAYELKENVPKFIKGLTSLGTIGAP